MCLAPPTLGGGGGGGSLSHCVCVMCAGTCVFVLCACSGPKRFSFNVASGQWVSTRDPSLTLLRLLSQELASLFPTADLTDLEDLRQ